MHTTQNAIDHITNSLNLACRLMDEGIPTEIARVAALNIADWMKDELARARAVEWAARYKNYPPCKSCSDNPLYGGAGHDCAECQL